MIFFAIIFFESGCPSQFRWAAEPSIVAMVCESPIPKVNLIAELRRLHVFDIKDDGLRVTVAKRVLDQMVDEELVLCAARDFGGGIPENQVQLALKRSSRGYTPFVFRQMLTHNLSTPGLFRKQLEEQMARKQYLSSALAPNTVVSTETSPDSKPRLNEIRLRDLLNGLKKTIPWFINQSAFFEIFHKV